MPTTGAVVQEDPVEAVLEACKPEIETFCSQVTPGEGRMAPCLLESQEKVALFGISGLMSTGAAVSTMEQTCPCGDRAEIAR